MAEESQGLWSRLGQHSQYMFIAIATALLVVVFSILGIYEVAELKAIDLRFTLRNAVFGAPRQYDKLATVDIDNVTLDRMGKFEDWNRVKFAEVAERAFTLGARAFVEDFLFIEHSLRRLTYDEYLSSGAATPEEFDALFPNPDSTLASVYAENGRVFIGSFFEESPHKDYDQAVKTQAPRLGDKEDRFQAMVSSSIPMSGDFQKDWFVAQDMGAPVARVVRAAQGVGHATPSEDVDGIVRQYRLFYVYNNRLFPALGLIAACDILGVPLETLVVEEREVILPQALMPGEKERRDISIPIDDRGEVLVNWAGRYDETYRHYPHIAVLDVAEINEEAKIATATKRLIWREPEMIDEIISTGLQGDPASLVDLVAGGQELEIPLDYAGQVVSQVALGAKFESMLDHGMSFEDGIGVILSDLLEEPVTLELFRELADEDPLYSEIVIRAYEKWQPIWTTVARNRRIAELMLDDPDISIDATADSLGVARPRDIEEGYYSLQYIVGRSSTVPAQDHPLLFNLLIVDGKPVYLQDFEDAVLFHGITATGGHDRNPIPYETRYPMVGLHVNVLNSILTEQFLHQLPRWATFLLIVGIGLLMGVVVPRMQAGLVAAVLVVVLIGYGVLALVLFSKQGIIIEVVGPMGTAVVSFLAITVSRYIQEEKEKRYIKDAFSSYLAPEVVAQLVDDPSRLQLGGDRKIITILFTDVAGFSTVSEALTAEELVILLNEYLTAMCDIIFKYGGTVDKFEGDLIMAFFGAPIEYEDHASRACQASLEMNTKLAEMREVWRKQGRHELYARIGLNTGGAVVGNMGSNQRMDYTVMGDSVNVASRLEGGNKPYGTYLMISADTYEMAKDDIEVRQLDMVTVVGRKEPVAVYEVLSLAGELDPDLARVREIYQAAHALYQDQQWTAAMLMFDEAISINDDPPSNTLKDRCESILRHEIEIPQRWDGVWELTEK